MPSSTTPTSDLARTRTMVLLAGWDVEDGHQHPARAARARPRLG
jgi:hypothetical protein